MEAIKLNPTSRDDFLNLLGRGKGLRQDRLMQKNIQDLSAEFFIAGNDCRGNLRNS